MKTRQMAISTLVGILLVVTLLVAACSAPAQAPAAPTSKEAPASQAAPASKEAAASKPAAAPAKIIELKLAGLEPPTSSTAKSQQDWIDKIEKETGGRVKFTAYWGGTLVKAPEGFTQLTSGVYDVGGALPQFAPASRFPVMNAVMYFFHGAPDYATNVKIYKEIFAKSPAVSKEFEGIKPLGVYPGSVNHFYSSKKPVRRLTDLKGMMVRRGPMDGTIVTALGAEGTNPPSAEIVQQIQKGILDGAFGQYTHLKDFKIADVVKYLTVLDWTGGPFVDLSMNINTWNSLPPDIQKVFEANADFLDGAFVKNRLGDDENGKNYAKQQGVEFIQLPAEDMKTLNSMAGESAAKMAADLEAKGIPGNKIHDDVQSLVVKYYKK